MNYINSAAANTSANVELCAVKSSDERAVIGNIARLGKEVMEANSIFLLIEERLKIVRATHPRSEGTVYVTIGTSDLSGEIPGITNQVNELRERMCNLLEELEI